MKKTLSLLGVLLLSAALLTGCGTEETEKENSKDTDSQEVFKTIDFGSYTGDSKSTDFNDLMDKKVTFTNVPTLGGMLGNMSKGITCKNESSYEIKDDVEYTVTGVVTYNIGTYSVTMKDCTITEE